MFQNDDIKAKNFHYQADKRHDVGTRILLHLGPWGIAEVDELMGSRNAGEGVLLCVKREEARRFDFGFLWGLFLGGDEVGGL